MKPRSQFITADGFDKNVAEKMPKIRKFEESFSPPIEAEPQPLKEDHLEPELEAQSLKKPAEKNLIFEHPNKKIYTEQSPDVLKLIEDLHGQLLVSAQTKRALEMDLISFQKTIHQLTQDNQELRHQLDALSKEYQRLQEIKSESLYLQEENADAMEKIKEFQIELREMKEALTKANQEREEAFERIRELELQVEQNEIIKLKEKLKEKEVSHFAQENRELQSKLEEALLKNIALEKKYEALRKSFNEVKESLVLLRDSCKKNYYNLSETPE